VEASEAQQSVHVRNYKDENSGKLPHIHNDTPTKNEMRACGLTGNLHERKFHSCR